MRSFQNLTMLLFLIYCAEVAALPSAQDLTNTYNSAKSQIETLRSKIRQHQLYEIYLFRK